MRRLILGLIFSTAAIECLIASPTTRLPVFQFDDVEHRNLWRVVEGSFPKVFSSTVGPAPGAVGSFLINTASSATGNEDESYTGAIESPPFHITQQFYAVLAGGGNYYDETFISVRDAKTREELWRTSGNNSNVMTTSPIDLSKGLGKTAIVRVEDRRTSNGGKILFGGLFETDQGRASAELVDFHINLLNWHRSRADGERWLNENLQQRHIPLLEKALVTRRNDAIHRVCINQLRRFPSASSVDALLKAATGPNEFTAQNACGVLRDHASIYPVAARQKVEQTMIQLVSASPSEDLRIIAAGTLLSLNTPTAIAAIHKAQKSAGQKAAHGMEFLIKSNRFTRTDFKLPAPGDSAECWLKGMQYYVYLPKLWNRGKKWPLLIGVHGTWGHGAIYKETFQAECDRVGAVGIAPTFDPHRFWGFGHFGGAWRPDLALIEIIQTNAAQLYLDNIPCVMFGHSEGAQFVGRFTLVHPNGVSRVAMSGTDELCWPDPSLLFPFGTGPNPEMIGGLPELSAESWLKVPTLLVVGTKDHRADISISEKWASAVNKFAEDNGLTQRVTFIRHEEGVHSLNSNFPLFQKWLEAGFERK